MKILVAGASGQVATSLVVAAKPSKTQLVALGRPALDLVQPDTLIAAIKQHQPDLIINTAAWTDVDAAEDDPSATHAINAKGAGELAKAAAEQGIGIIHFSTDYVYDGAGNTPFCESDKTAPQNVYGHSKLAGEQAVIAVNPRHWIIRTSWVFSPYGHNFLKTVLRLAGQHSALKMVADQTGCPTYAPHLAEAVLQLATQIQTRGEDCPVGLFSLAGTGATHWAGFAEEVLTQSAKRGGPSADIEPVASSAFPTTAKRPTNSILNCSKAKQTFDITLPPWQQGVTECLDVLLK
ncbi:dTDP-4-dehydrorhamnose reductase [hydrothermal vent metagenome]|uniref:dTDP-4-dehydrorhamnose reductase n=1 Tax=hydrothermal vent metagenome TaxID=652676 RepID=A0A3B0SLV7_9ZZZZ